MVALYKIIPGDIMDGCAIALNSFLLAISLCRSTEDYHICSRGYTLGIEIIDQTFSLRSYRTAILTGSNPRGDYHARPENLVISKDGTKLFYTATVKEDVYRFDFTGNIVGQTSLFREGIYTVTMDLRTGEQTYTGADLPKS